MIIPLSKPSITQLEMDAVVRVMGSGHLAQGEVVQQFEEAFAKYCGKKYAVAVSSGTAGLFLCLKALGIGRGHKIATTPYTFCATVTSIIHAGAIPFFVDVNRDTYNLDVRNLIRRSPGIDFSAILPVDIFGNCFNTNKIHGLPIICDACESLGSKMDRNFDMAVYSFYPNKVITMGEGGCIVTNNKMVAKFCRAMRNQGRFEGDSWLTSTYCGYNYRLTDLQAAMGLVQLSRIDEILENRLTIYYKYIHRFIESGVIDNIRLQKHEEGCKVAPFVMSIEVENRDRMILELKKRGIETRNYFPCVHLQPFMLKKGYEEGIFPVAEEISKRTMSIPFYYGMKDEEIDYVVENLKTAMEDA